MTNNGHKFLNELTALKAKVLSGVGEPILDRLNILKADLDEQKVKLLKSLQSCKYMKLLVSLVASVLDFVFDGANDEAKTCADSEPDFNIGESLTMTSSRKTKKGTGEPKQHQRAAFT